MSSKVDIFVRGMGLITSKFMFLLSSHSDHIRCLTDIGSTERNSYTATIGFHWLGWGWISDFVSNKSLQQLADQADPLCSGNIYAQTFA